MLFILAPSAVLFAILMLMSPNQRVGFDLSASVLFLTGKIGFYMSGNFFQRALMVTLMKGQKNTKALVRAAVFGNNVTTLLSISLGLLPFAPFATQDMPGGPQVANTIYAFYFVGSVLSMWINLGMAVYLKSAFSKALNKSYQMSKKEKLIEIRDRVVDFERQITIQAAVQSMIYLSFLVSTFYVESSQLLFTDFLDFFCQLMEDSGTDYSRP